MPTGRLAATFLSTTSNTLIYTTPASNVAVATISVCNVSDVNTSLLKLALTTDASNNPATSEYIEYNVPIEPNKVLERTGIVINSSIKIVATASFGNTLSISVYGFEQSA